MADVNDARTAKIIGKNITNMLIERDMTQQDLCNALHISKATMSTWINGTRMPRMTTLDKIGKYFGVTRTQLMEIPGASIHPSPHEEALIVAYRSASKSIREAVCKLLDIAE